MPRRRRRNSNETRQRDTFDIASRRLRDVDTTVHLPTFRRGPDLSPFEDRRFWDPLGDFRPARTLNRRSAATIVEMPAALFSEAQRAGHLGGSSSSHPSRRGPSTFSSRSVFRFRVPEKVAICVRRKRRKEVLFAKRRTGKGSRSPKHRNYYSEVSCSR